MLKRKAADVLKSDKTKRRKVCPVNHMLAAEADNITTTLGFPLCVVRDFEPRQILEFQTHYSVVGLQVSGRDVTNIIDSVWKVNLTSDIGQLIVNYLVPRTFENPRTNLMFKLEINEEIKRRKGYHLTPAGTTLSWKYNAYRKLSRPQIFQEWRFLANTAVVVVPSYRIKEWKSEIKGLKHVRLYENASDLQEMEIPNTDNKEYKLDYLSNLSINLFDTFRKYQLILVSARHFDKFAFASINCDLVFGRVFFQNADTLRLSSGHYIHALRYWAISNSPKDFSNMSSSRQHFLRWMLKQDESKFHII